MTTPSTPGEWFLTVLIGVVFIALTGLFVDLICNVIDLKKERQGRNAK